MARSVGVIWTIFRSSAGNPGKNGLEGRGSELGETHMRGAKEGRRSGENRETVH